MCNMCDLYKPGPSASIQSPHGDYATSDTVRHYVVKCIDINVDGRYDHWLYEIPVSFKICVHMCVYMQYITRSHFAFGSSSLCIFYYYY